MLIDAIRTSGTCSLESEVNDAANKAEKKTRRADSERMKLDCSDPKVDASSEFIAGRIDNVYWD